MKFAEFYFKQLFYRLGSSELRLLCDSFFRISYTGICKSTIGTISSKVDELSSILSQSNVLKVWINLLTNLFAVRR